jgi:hypothetical protein
MSNLLTLKKTFFLPLVLVSVFFWWGCLNKKDNPTSKQTVTEQLSNEKEIELKIFKEQVISLKDSIKKLNKEINYYKKRTNFLTTSLVSIHKKYGNEKIYILPKSEYDDITKFLSDRYKDSLK